MLVGISYNSSVFLFKRNERMIDLELDLEVVAQPFLMCSKEYRIVIAYLKIFILLAMSSKYNVKLIIVFRKKMHML